MNEPLTINGLQVTIDDAAKFAPIVRFQENEEYFPCSMPFILKGSALVLGDGRTIEHPTQDDLYAARNDLHAHLRIHPSIWGGEKPVNGLVPAPMYVCPQVPEDRSFVDFNFYFLSAFNGPQAAHVRAPFIGSFDCAIEEFAFHQGDVEGIAVRVTPDFSRIIHVRYTAHGDDTYYLPSQVPSEGLHPIVQCAVFSHASYNYLDRSRFLDRHASSPTYEVELDSLDLGVAKIHFIDDISWGKVSWRPFTSRGNRTVSNGQLVFIGFDQTIDRPINGQKWASFQGDLGERRSNGFTRAIHIREELTFPQKALFDSGAFIADLLRLIPSKYRSGAGPDGFGQRQDYMIMQHPSGPRTDVVVMVSKSNPMSVMATSSQNPGGPLAVEPLAFNQTPHFNQHWLRTSFVSKVQKAYILTNGATNLAAAVPNQAPKGTQVGQVPGSDLGPGALWTVGESASWQSLRPSYNDDLNVRTQDPIRPGGSVTLGGWDGGKPYETWGIIPIRQGISKPAMVSMFRSATDDILWYTVFDAATGVWFPGARIGQGMSTISGVSMVAYDGRLMAAYAGTDGGHQLWYTMFETRTGTWQGNHPFGQGMSSTEAPALAVLNDTLYCIHKGGKGDDHLWWMTFDRASQTWRKDVRLDMESSAAPALAVANGTLYCVHKGSSGDDNLWWMAFDAAKGVWNKDKQFGGGMRTRGVALAALKGTLYCVHRGTDDQLYWTTFDPQKQAWAQNQPFGQGMSASAAPALAVYDDKLYCIHKGNKDDHLWWTVFDDQRREWIKDRTFDFDARTQSGPGFAAASGVD